MAQARINLGQTDTGHVIGDFTWDWCKTWAGTAVSTTGSTLTEIGDGCYIITNPNVTVRTEFRVYLTATPTKWSVGTFEDAPATLAAPSAPYLCTRARVKAALKIATSNTDLDDAVDEQILAASDWIERYCGQSFALTEYTLYFSPGRRDFNVLDMKALSCPHYPLVSVTSLHEDSEREFAAASLIPATDYYIRGRQLVLYDTGTTRSFTAGERTVKAVVTAGYATIPATLQTAAAMLATWLYKLGERMKSDVASESSGGHTVSYKDDDMPKPVVAMLKSGGFLRAA